MSQVAFDEKWLHERFEHDNTARNKRVGDAFFDFVKGKKVVTIVDIGSGTGANCLYFLEKLEQDQHWLLIEKDEQFLEPTFRRLSGYARKQDYDFQIEERSMKIITGSKEVNITIINDTFFNLSHLVDLNLVDVVMAAAVFDLLSADQFETLGQIIFPSGIAMLTTMNYSAMRFHPERELDRKFIDLYEQHMIRQQHFGRGMGKYCASFLEQYFEKRKYPFFKGKSKWQLNPKAFVMHKYLLGFMENSICELLSDPDDIVIFQNWLSEKTILSQNQLLTIEVEHFDFFITPK